MNMTHMLEKTAPNQVAATVYKSKKCHEYDKHIKRLAAEDSNMEAGLLNKMLEESTYTEISESYLQLLLGSGNRTATERTDIQVQDRAMRVGTGNTALGKAIQMDHHEGGAWNEKCKDDPCVFIKHDGDGRLTLWAVMQSDDVVYGGLKSEMDNLKK